MAPADSRALFFWRIACHGETRKRRSNPATFIAVAAVTS
jgi:hypothetical protein